MIYGCCCCHFFSIHFGEQMYNVNGLQKVCDVLLEYPSWSIAHLIAYFNLAEYINNSKVLELIDDPDYANKMTPIQVSSHKCNLIIHYFYQICFHFILQLAIKHGHFEMVKKLLPQCKFTHLDGNDNSLFHYAAPTTKEFINVNIFSIIIVINIDLKCRMGR